LFVFPVQTPIKTNTTKLLLSDEKKYPDS